MSSKAGTFCAVRFCFPHRRFQAPQWTECELRKCGHFGIPANLAGTSPVSAPHSFHIYGIQ